MIEGHQTHILRCNALLQRRIKSFRWTYYVYLAGATVFLLVPSVLVSTQVIPVLTNDMKTWDRFLFFLIFIVVNFIFWMRLHRGTIIQLDHLAFFPLTCIRKYALLALAGAADPRSAVGGVLGLVFLFSELPKVIVGMGMLITTILFFLCLEIWLLNCMLGMGRLLKEIDSVSYILGVVPMWILWMNVLFQNLVFLEWFPFGNWAGAAVSCAKMNLWAGFGENVGKLFIGLLFGLLMGGLLIKRRSYSYD